MQEISSLAYKLAIGNLILMVIIFLAKSLAGNFEAVTQLAGYSCIGLALYPLVSTYFSRGKAGMLTCFIAANTAPVWFLYLEGVLPGYDARELLPPEMRIEGYLWASIYAFFYNFFYYWFFRKVAPALHRRFPMSTPNPSPGGLGIASILMFVVPLVVIGSRYNSLGEVWDSLTKGRVGGEGMGVLLRVSNIGGSEAFYQPLMWLFQIVPAVSAMAVDSSIRSRRFSLSAWIGLAFGISVIFFYFLGGSRGQFIQMLAGPAGILIYRNLKRGWIFTAAAVGAFVLLIGLMEFQVRTRGNMLEKMRDTEEIAATSKDGEVTTFNPLKAHRDNNMYLSCLIVNRMPDPFPFDGFKQFWVDICNPIPRALWPNKPTSQGALMDKSFVDQVLQSGPLELGTTSLSTTVVGDFYKMGGLFGIFLIALIFSLGHIYNDFHYLRLKQKNTVSIGIQAVACFLAFWGFRAFGTVITMGYPFIGVMIYLIVKKMLHNQDSAPVRRRTSPLKSLPKSQS
jgi:hypothetical protein